MISWRHPLPDDLLAYRPRPRFLTMLPASRDDNRRDVRKRQFVRTGGASFSDTFSGGCNS